jgi:hypothetical protein
MPDPHRILHGRRSLTFCHAPLLSFTREIEGPGGLCAESNKTHFSLIRAIKPMADGNRKAVESGREKVAVRPLLKEHTFAYMHLGADAPFPEPIRRLHHCRN